MVKLEVEPGAGLAFGVSLEEEREGSHPGAGGGFDGKWREKASTSMSRSGCGGEGGGMEEYEARVPGVPISRWAAHKRRRKKAGGRWVERGSSPDYFICSCRNNIRGQGGPGELRGAAGPGAEVQLRLETRKQPTTQTWRDSRATGKIRIVCDAVVSVLFVGCCRFDGRSPPNVMSQSSHGERMAG